MLGYFLYVLVPAVLYAVVFMRAVRHEQRGAAYAAAAAGAVLLGLLVLFALLIFGLRCDESCNEGLVPSVRRAGWKHSSGSWEWGAQLALALTAFATGLLPIVLLRFRRSRGAVVAAAATEALVIAWVLFVFSG